MVKKEIFLFLFLIFLSSCATISTPVRKPTKQQTTQRKAQPNRTKTYQIKSGDSLWRIAKNYNTSVNEIKLINKNIDANDLKIGQKIIIPKKKNLLDSKFIWPVDGMIINNFGKKVDYITNKGIDILDDSSNHQVQASSDGKIIYANKLKGWGKTIIIQHKSGFYSIYANLDETFTSEGQSVSKSDTIGNIASGKNGKYVLHFEIRKKSIPENPLKYLN